MKGQGGSGSQEQPRREIMNKDKLGRQGGSGSEEQPRRETMKGDKLGRQGGTSQEQPKREITKGDKLGREKGNHEGTSLGDKAAVQPRAGQKQRH